MARDNFDEPRRLLQCGKAEIGRSRSADRPVHGADAFLDLVLGVVLYGFHLAVGQAVPLCLRQILVTPSMRADRMSGRSHLLEYARLVCGVEADREKDGLGAVRGERGQDRRRVLWPRPVVESKHNLPFTQEVMRLEMLEAESGATRGVDLDDARYTECIRITWT